MHCFFQMLTFYSHLGFNPLSQQQQQAKALPLFNMLFRGLQPSTQSEILTRMNDVLQLIRCKPVIAGCLRVIKRVRLTCVSCQIDKELKVLQCLRINPFCHHNTLFPNNQISITLVFYPVSQSIAPISILTALCYSSLHSQKWLKKTDCLI